MEKYDWNNVKISILGKEIDFGSVNYYSKKDDVFLPFSIEIDIKALQEIASHEFVINESSKYGRSLIVDGLEIKADSRLCFNENEYLVMAVLEDRIILELISQKL